MHQEQSTPAEGLGELDITKLPYPIFDLTDAEAEALRMLYKKPLDPFGYVFLCHQIFFELELMDYSKLMSKINLSLKAYHLEAYFEVHHQMPEFIAGAVKIPLTIRQKIRKEWLRQLLEHHDNKPSWVKKLWTSIISRIR